MILGLWLTSRRLTNPWLAAGAVWVIALIPAASKIYSMAISEGLIACLLVWVMFLTLGEKRQLWQLVLGSILAGLDRNDPHKPAASAAALMLVHPLAERLEIRSLGNPGVRAYGCHLPCLLLAEYPALMGLLAARKPRAIPESMAPTRRCSSFWDPTVTLAVRLSSLMDGVRFYFIPVIGALTAWVLWPRKSTWKSPALYRIAVFLSALFLSLLALHAWASLIQNYCVYCFPIYLSFFASIGLLLVVVTIASWQTRLDRWRQIAAGLIIIAVFAGIGFSLIPAAFIEKVMELPVPRIRSMHFLPGNAELWQVISNKFHLELEALVPIFSMVIPVLFGVLCCGICLLIAIMLPRLYKRFPTQISAGAQVMIFILLAGWILSPTAWLGNGYHRYDCAGDVLAADELAGKALPEAIPPRAQIFWRGISPVTLLHLPQAEIYPAQLNGDYSFRLGGETDELLRYGWWDKSLGLQWAKEADFILVAQKYDKGWLKDTLESGDYQEITIFPARANNEYSGCLADVYPRIFTKKP